MKDTITVEVHIHAPIEKVWEAFVNPETVTKWNTASEDWHTPRSTNDLRTGGSFSYRMEAKDGSEGFDFTGIYDEVRPHEYLSFVMDDGRKVTVAFTPEEGGVHVVETFEPEQENTREMQQAGWQAILDNFKRYVEGATQKAAD